jgi:hypothetical protein
VEETLSGLVVAQLVNSPAAITNKIAQKIVRQCFISK